jgi:uncharacterized protein YndB with AHSA1/START domain
MIRYRDSVRIDVPPARVWAWLEDLPSHYREWHPAHVGCRYLHGRRLEVGAILRFEETLHGTLHTLTVHATRVVPERSLRYAGRGFRGAFELEPVDGGTRFTAELELGARLPLVEPLIDGLVRRLAARQLAALSAHMREEGRNLKGLLEATAVTP